MIDWTKPLELYDPKTGEAFDALSVPTGGFRKKVIRTDGVRTTWVNYEDDGSPYIPSNNFRVRNKVDVNLVDLNKPLYVDGKRVYPVTLLTNAGTWPKMYGDRPYVNIYTQDRHPTFYTDTGENQTNPNSPRLSNDPNYGKVTNMLDLNKPITVNGKDAKIIHTFPSGVLAVVVEGYGEVQHFNSDGSRTGALFGSELKNKPVETVRYVNVYPEASGGAQVSIYRDRRPVFTETNGVQIKQTLIDGKVVKNEII
jgi:hypothetical protein